MVLQHFNSIDSSHENDDKVRNLNKEIIKEESMKGKVLKEDYYVISMGY